MARFIERPGDLPPFPGLVDIDWPATDVAVERSLRFPWSGGRHPWLDAVVETPGSLIGVESKRFEPYRDTKTVNLSDAYDRPVWGNEMRPFEAMRDLLRSSNVRYDYLDAAQLVKHAFGLVTQGRKLNKSPVLLYLYAEPAERAGHPIATEVFERHRSEVRDFARRVQGAAVRFGSCSYREWLIDFRGDADQHGTGPQGTRPQGNRDAARL